MRLGRALLKLGLDNSDTKAAGYVTLLDVSVNTNTVNWTRRSHIRWDDPMQGIVGGVAWGWGGGTEWVGYSLLPVRGLIHLNSLRTCHCPGRRDYIDGME